MKQSMLALAAAALMSLPSGRAVAETIYDFSYSGIGGPTSISGTLTVEDTKTSGGYLIDAISATASYSDGSTYSITTLNPPGGFANNDNLLFLTSPGVPGAGPYLSYYGFSFDSGSFQTNLYFDNGAYRQANDSTPANDSGTFTLTAAPPAVPEPSSLFLLGTAGLMGLGLAARKRRAA